MTDQDVRDLLRRMAAEEPIPFFDTEPLIRRARRRASRAIAVVVVGVAATVAVLFANVADIRTTPEPVPADPPTPTEGLGIFAPVAGRIFYEEAWTDPDREPGLWAIDPSKSSDTGGPVGRFSDDDMTPLGWSRDGTELLFKRSVDPEALFPDEYLYILHADGTETRLNNEPMYFAEHGAAISPDGERVVFAAWADHLGLYVVDADGGRPVPLPYPAYGLPASPTYSPDGSQIAYLVYGDSPAGAPHEEHVWIADADGSDAHEILADDEVRFACGALQWSPAGDRLACEVRGSERNGDVDSIYTFGPDGSEFEQVINGGASPYWSPDGSQIAFTRTVDGIPVGLAIADADGSDVREFGLGASGPWHPSASVQEGETA